MPTANLSKETAAVPFTLTRQSARVRGKIRARAEARASARARMARELPKGRMSNKHVTRKVVLYWLSIISAGSAPPKPLDKQNKNATRSLVVFSIGYELLQRAARPCGASQQAWQKCDKQSRFPYFSIVSGGGTPPRTSQQAKQKFNKQMMFPCHCAFNSFRGWRVHRTSEQAEQKCGNKLCFPLLFN